VRTRRLLHDRSTSPLSTSLFYMAGLMDIQKDRYVTMAVVAEMLSCTERHVYDLIMEGALVAIKVGSRAIRISERSLGGFIEKNKVNPEDLFDPDREEKKTPAPTRPAARPMWMARTSPT